MIEADPPYLNITFYIPECSYVNMVLGGNTFFTVKYCKTAMKNVNMTFIVIMWS